MYTIVKWFYLTALVVWVGEIVFFSFVVAPGIFRTFAAPEAGRAVGAIFPTYYRIGYACGVVLLAASVVFARSGSSPRAWGMNALLAAAMLGATVYAGVLIQPRAAELRPNIHDAAAPPALKEEFDRLHRLAVTLNGVVLLGGIAVSVVTATALRP